MTENEFEQLAKSVETKGGRVDAPGHIAAAQIRAQRLQYEQQDRVLDEVNGMNARFVQLEEAVGQLKSAIDAFNRDSGRLYENLNWWTKVIAIATIANLACMMTSSFNAVLPAIVK